MNLNEETIGASLQELVAELEAGNYEDANEILRELNFNRLRRPIEDPSKGRTRLFVDPSCDFETDRVHEVGDFLDAAARAIQLGSEKALTRAKQALERWSASA